MWCKLHDRFETQNAFMALAVVLGVALSWPAQAAEIWKVDLSKSTFGVGSNTLVLERASGMATPPGSDAKQKPAASSFLVIANSKLYLATNDAAYNTSSSGVREVDYARWKDMNLIPVGDNVRPTDICGFRCQQGLHDNRMTLRFTTNADVRRHMSDILVFNE